MTAMSFESVGIIRPGCPTRPAAARFRRAFEWPILTRPPIRATQPSTLLQVSVKISSHGMNIGLPIGKEFASKRQNFFAWNEYWFADWQGISHKIAEIFST